LFRREAGTEIETPSLLPTSLLADEMGGGEERADCSLKTSRQEIARAE